MKQKTGQKKKNREAKLGNVGRNVKDLGRKAKLCSEQNWP